MDKVKIIATKIIKRLPANVNLKDLIQSGVLGLMDAMDKYDPSTGILFYTYAQQRIRGAILDSLRNKKGGDHFSFGTRQKTKQILEMLEENEHKIRDGLEAPTDEDMAKKLGMDLEAYRNYLSLAISGDDHVSLDIVNGGENSKETHILDTKTKHPDQLIHEREVKEKVQFAFEKFLSSVESEKDKVRFRYLYEEYTKGRTLKEIGKDLKVNESRASQLLTEIRQGMKPILLDQGFTTKDISW